MKDVKKNLKVISHNMTKQFLIDFTLAIVEDLIVDSVIQYIPNQAAKTAVKISGYVGYFVVAKHFTKEEQQSINEAVRDMLSRGKASEEIETEINDLIEKMKMMEDSAKRKSGEEPEGQDA